MKLDSTWRRVAAAFAIGAATLLAGCNTPPAFQVSQPSARDGTVAFSTLRSCVCACHDVCGLEMPRAPVI